MSSSRSLGVFNSDNQLPGSKDSQCSLNLTSSARKAKRKLMFTGDVLRGHKFYLHLKNTNLDQESLEKDIVNLGGLVEKFLSKDITRVVVPSAKFLKDASPKGNGKRSANASPEISTSFLSRGRALLLKSNISKANNTKTEAPCDPVGFAKKWNIKIIFVKELQSIIGEEKFKLDSSVCSPIEPLKSRPLARNRLTKPKTLTGAFIKIEDESKHYRVLHHDFDTFPPLHLSTTGLQSPFEAGPAKRKQQPISPTSDEPKIKVKSRVKSQPAQKLVKPSQGFCECCDVMYKDIRYHCKSERHKAYARNKENYATLDSTIKSLPDLSNLLRGFTDNNPDIASPSHVSQGPPSEIIDSESVQPVKPVTPPPSPATAGLSQTAVYEDISSDGAFNNSKCTTEEVTYQDKMVQESPSQTDCAENNYSPLIENIASPLIENIGSPLKEDIASPLLDNIRSPLKEDTASPLIDNIASPLIDNIASPLKENITSHLKEYNPSPLKEYNPSPLKEYNPSPLKYHMSSPMKYKGPSPLKDDNPISMEYDFPSPVKNDGHSPPKDDEPNPMDDDIPSIVTEDSAPPVKDDSAICDDNHSPLNVFNDLKGGGCREEDDDKQKIADVCDDLFIPTFHTVLFDSVSADVLQEGQGSVDLCQTFPSECDSIKLLQTPVKSQGITLDTPVKSRELEQSQLPNLSFDDGFVSNVQTLVKPIFNLLNVSPEKLPSPLSSENSPERQPQTVINFADDEISQMFPNVAIEVNKPILNILHDCPEKLASRRSPENAHERQPDLAINNELAQFIPNVSIEVNSPEVTMVHAATRVSGGLPIDFDVVEFEEKSRLNACNFDNPVAPGWECSEGSDWGIDISTTCHNVLQILDRDDISETPGAPCPAPRTLTPPNQSLAVKPDIDSTPSPTLPAEPIVTPELPPGGKGIRYISEGSGELFDCPDIPIFSTPSPPKHCEQSADAAVVLQSDTTHEPRSSSRTDYFSTEPSSDTVEYNDNEHVKHGMMGFAPDHHHHHLQTSRRSGGKPSHLPAAACSPNISDHPLNSSVSSVESGAGGFSFICSYNDYRQSCPILPKHTAALDNRPSLSRQNTSQSSGKTDPYVLDSRRGDSVLYSSSESEYSEDDDVVPELKSFSRSTASALSQFTRDSWRVNRTSDLKLKFCRVMLTPANSDKVREDNRWGVKNSGDCRLTFSATRSGKRQSDHLRDSADGEHAAKRKRLVY